MQPRFADKCCLVTGGTGFIGGRLVASLAADGAEIRVLARDLSKASLVGRFPVKLIRGDLTRREDVQSAAAGCDFVFHCACGTTGDKAAMRAATVDGTRYVIDACQEHRARLVHVSTVSVYGATPDGELDESAPRRPEGDFYAETKLEAEKAVLEAARGGKLRASVIQPTVVHGPFGPAWTVRILNELKSGRVMLIDGGDGLCNVVYVDDVVQALRLAALDERALGEAFLISGPKPVTWREFYGAHEELLGFESHVERSAAEADALFQRLHGRKRFLREILALVRDNPSLRKRLKTTREAQALLRAAKLVVPSGARKSIQNKLRGVGPGADGTANTVPSKSEKPIHSMGPVGIRLFRAKTSVSIEKARRLLGYEPAFSFQAGMARIAQWARWANLVDLPKTEPVG